MYMITPYIHPKGFVDVLIPVMLLVCELSEGINPQVLYLSAGSG